MFWRALRRPGFKPPFTDEWMLLNKSQDLSAERNSQGGYDNKTIQLHENHPKFGGMAGYTCDKSDCLMKYLD